MFWSFTGRISQHAIQFIVGVVLARLLYPEDFGLIAMLGIFTAFSRAFVHGGFSQALIQKQDVTEADKSSVFFFNIVAGIATWMLLCLAAPAIAAFYENRELVPLTRALSLNLLIVPFGVVQVAILTRRLDFKKEATISASATLLSGITGITAAYLGFRAWSLVAQTLTFNLVHTGSLWVLNSWRPAFVFSIASLKSMFRFGSKLLASELLVTVFDNVFLLVIGKMFSPRELGYYARAYKLQRFPVYGIFGSVGVVTFPVFSAMQRDKTRLKNMFRRSLSTLAFLTFPLMIGLAVTAKPLVITLLTSKWLPCVPYLQLLCVVGVFYPLHALHRNVLASLGQSTLVLWSEVIQKSLMVVAVIATFQLSVTHMICGQIVVAVVSYLVIACFSGTQLDYGAGEQTVDLLSSLLLASTMGVIVYSLKYAMLDAEFMLLFIQVISGIVIYGLLSYAFGVSSFFYVLEIAGLKLSPMKGTRQSD